MKKRIHKGTSLMVLSALVLLLLLLGAMQQQQQVRAATASSSVTPTVITRTIVLTPTKDNTLYEDNAGATSNGVGAFFFVGKTNGDSIRRGLLAFDVAGQVPPGARVVSATLQLQMSKTTGGAVAVALHRAQADWGEGTSDASGNEGSGVSATTGDATWLHTHFDTALWQTPGGDFVPTATASITVDGIGAYLWPSSPAMVAEVQGWLDDSTTNFGWVVMGDESSNRTTKRFVSRESGSPTSRPQLTVVYTITGTAQSTIYLPLVQN